MTSVEIGTPGGNVDRSGLDETARLRLAAALRGAVRGEVDFGTGVRALYSTDSSNYRQVPLGVVYPRDADDTIAAVRVCAAHNAPIVSRGAGTSLAGQACNVAVVLDFTRYCDQILEIDPERRIARVQPGIVLDHLRAATEKHGLTFGPDPATHAWCTIGGMIGNNSCGTHALYAGKTVDNVERLTVVTYGGEVLDLGSYDDRAYAAAVAGGGELARVLGGLREIGRRYGDLVRERFPDIPRRVSGYNLDQLLPGGDLNAARALVGTESTCVVVLEATLRLSPSPRHRRLVVLGYPDVFAAADAVPAILEANPGLLGLEGFDDTLVAQMRRADLNTEHLPLLPPGRGWLLAEVGDDDPDRAGQRADRLIAGLPAGVEHRRYDDPREQARVWVIRESGLGATARPPGQQPNHEGWEDAAVHPRQLGAYLRGMTGLWRDYGYTGAWYGHFGQGCVHTRNNFDLHTLDGLRSYREFARRAADLVVSLGGSLSGEHGDGQARGELLERMYGPELIDAFRQFKAVWDPRGRMNPGKVVDPYPLDTNLRHGPSYRRTVLDGTTFFAFAADGGSFQDATDRCVGVGRCRRDDTGVMCPSYRATGQERHSTRGRARLLAEMMQGEVTPETWRNADVREALDLCLSCKGCAVDCPTHVDMATYKAEFMAHHYRRRLRPRAMYALGLLPWATRLAGRLPGPANAVLGGHVLGRLVRRAAGLTVNRPAPRFAAVPFRRTPQARSHAGTGAGRTSVGRTSVGRTGADRTGADNRAGGGAAGMPDVVLWPDTFSNAFRPEFAGATLAALAAAGQRVEVPREWACCGRTLYDAGMLTLARHSLRRVLDVLAPYIAAQVPVVVPEPSCLATFRDELPALLADDPRAPALAALARSLSEHLLAVGARPGVLPDAPAGSAGKVLVHPHCHGRAVGTPAADRELLGRLGYEVEILDAGCCGLAGSFGYRAEHEPVSRKIAEEYWLPKLRAHAVDKALVVDGFSCVMQLDQLDGRPAATLPDLVVARLRS